ncbi:MAG: PH domain-containing protein [Clostridiales bacterium]|nr:PH domain-containing protein [Clostridiales bacterium]
MAKNKKNQAIETAQDPVLWHDRKRVLGMPLSFTVYEITDDRLTLRKGFFRTETDEILLYRILDIKMVRTFGQKLCGVGTVTLYSADQSHHTLELKNIKSPDKVRKFISSIVERERAKRGLVGREMYGSATVGMDHDGCAHGADQVFVDTDGDGIPD